MIIHTSQWLWGVNGAFSRCQSRVPLQVYLPQGPGLTPCPSPRPHSAAKAPRQAFCPVRQQVARPASTGAASQGMWGWSRCFLPRHRFPQLLAGQAMLGRKAGRREAANSHVQPGLSKRCFLPPPSAASAAVASGWLTMLAGAGALRLGRVTSLNCPCPSSPQHTWPACLPGEWWGA